MHKFVASAFMFLSFWQVAQTSIVRSNTLNTVQWISDSKVDADATLSALLRPSGVGGNLPYYIGRIHINGGSIPGKCAEGGFNYVINGREIWTPFGFEYLLYPRGVLIWKEVTVKDNEFLHDPPKHLFKGGSAPTTGENLYVCRAWHANQLIMGKFSTFSKMCEVGLFHRSYQYKEFDALVWNNWNHNQQDHTMEKSESLEDSFFDSNEDD